MLSSCCAFGIRCGGGMETTVCLVMETRGSELVKSRKSAYTHWTLHCGLGLGADSSRDLDRRRAHDIAKRSIPAPQRCGKSQKRCISTSSINPFRDKSASMPDTSQTLTEVHRLQFRPWLHHVQNTRIRHPTNRNAFHQVYHNYPNHTTP